MGSMSLKLRAIAAVSLGLMLGLARAQDGAPPDADPPDRAARLSFIQGEVSMQPAGEDQWAPAMLNRPLTTGDQLWTEQDARAEIQVGAAAVRLDSDTGFSFLNVDDDTIQMRMTAGVINVSVRALDGNDHIEIDTPDVALSLLRPGNYRVEVNEASDTTVVRISAGEAEASASSQSTIVHNQQVATFRGSEVTAQLGTLGAPDEFDTWSLERDRRDENAASSQTAQYVAPEVTGYQDLDDNGSWSSEPEYGQVWTPTHVAVGWAPYQYGRWMWVNPWGWTWIDDASWGYAPFHYGRWAHVRERWCWVPGPRHVRAVYAPALVGWVDAPGASLTISSGGGGVAWFPLGPREVYVPARRFSPRYVERVNVTNTVIVNRTVIHDVYENRATNVTYRNRSVPGAVTAVSRSTFTTAARVNDHRVRLSEQDIAQTRVIAAAPHIAPARESRMGVSGPSRVAVHPPRPARVDRPVAETEPRVSPDRPRAERPPQPQPNREQARQQQAREQQAREQQARNQAELQRRQQQQQRQQDTERQAAARQAPPRERNPERPHREHPDGNDHADRPALPKKQDDQQRN
jgi:hypothetical protein